MNAVSINNLSNIYGKGKEKIIALTDVSFAFPEKSIYGFISPNGMGKSTTTGIVFQFLSQDQGNVQIFDQPVNENFLPFLKKFIGFIPDALSTTVSLLL